MKKLVLSLRLGALIFMSVSFIACGNKNSNDGAYVPVGTGVATGTGICPGCNMMQGSLFTSSANYSSMSMNIEMIGDQNMINQLLHMGYAPAKHYNGQVMIRGVLNVSTQVMAGNCVLQPGQYQLMSMSPGTYQAGTFALQQFEAVNGGFRVILGMQGVIVDADANGQPEGFGAQLYVLQGPSMYGSYASCMDSIGFTLAP